MSHRKRTIGLVEVVRIYGMKGDIAKKALFDTGATSTSIDLKLAAKVGIGPIVGVKRVVSASNPQGKLRPLAEAYIRVKGKKVKVRANIEDRSGLKYKILVGRDVIHSNFVIDTSKTHTSHRIEDVYEKTEPQAL